MANNSTQIYSAQNHISLVDLYLNYNYYTEFNSKDPNFFFAYSKLPHITAHSECKKEHTAHQNNVKISYLKAYGLATNHWLGYIAATCRNF
jgi:hypothetical protein